jgi:hypothetical protein
MSALSFGVAKGRGRWVTIKTTERVSTGMTLSWRQAAALAASLLLLLTCSAVGQTPAARAPGARAAPPARKAAHAARHKRGTSRPSPVPAPETVPPPAPLTPEQMPPSPPEVTYQNGLLTIVATNSTLSDILHSVATRTGATVDAPPHLTGERVAAHIGPGTPRAVLSDLLTGPRFDYILVGADGDPNGVHSIILTPSQSSSSGAAAMAQPVRPVVAPQEDTDTEEDVGVYQPLPPGTESPEPARQFPPGQRRFMPQLPPDQFGERQVPSPEGGNQQQPQIKTPEQLLQQLRRMQQQGNPNPPQR